MFGGRYFGGRYFGRRYFGKAGLVLDGAHFGARYFGPRYFGSGYFGSNGRREAFEITQTQGIGLSGALGVASPGFVSGAVFEITQTQGIGLNASLSVGAALTFENEVFYIGAPIAVGGLTGTVAVAATLVFGGPTPGYGSYWGRRYFGGRYFGPRYWGSPSAWQLEVTQGIGLTGTLTAASGITTQLAIAPSAIGLTGSLSLAGAVTIDDVPATDFHPVGGKKRRRALDRGSANRRYDVYHNWVRHTLIQLAAAGVFDA